jgi:PIN domain nuclease of toxin-antitoxin system
MTPPYLFDSHALLAFFQNEEGAEIVAEILQRAVKEGLDRLICVINLGEHRLDSLIGEKSWASLTPLNT